MTTALCAKVRTCLRPQGIFCRRQAPHGSFGQKIVPIFWPDNFKFPDFDYFNYGPEKLSLRKLSLKKLKGFRPLGLVPEALPFGTECGSFPVDDLAVYDFLNLVVFSGKLKNISMTSYQMLL
jgi:hypothetical protein